MAISAKDVMTLREKTGVGMMDCKHALTETEGNMEKAVELLRKKGLAKAEKRAERATKQGIIYSYIHTGGSIGVMLELNCETDFVARTDDFAALAKDIAMHVAAADPMALDRDGMPADLVEKEKKLYMEQAKETGKPDNIVEKIAEGKLGKFYSENCLLEQKFIRDQDVSIQDMLNGAVAKIGEKITLRRFVRYAVGQEL